jgi:uncharacterized protein
MSFHRIALLFAFSLCLEPAAAASFDCGKASTHVEKAICTAPDVGALDVELAKRFQDGLKTHAPPEWREEQRRWLREVRDPCPDVACLRSAYAARLDQLAHRDDPAAIDAAVFGTYVVPTEIGYLDPDAQDWKVGESTDCLSITASADGAAEFSIESIQTNGHSCAIYETAHRTDNVFEFLDLRPEAEAWDQCRLRLVVKQGVIEVEAEGCRGYCGMRAGLDGMSFPRALKVAGKSTCDYDDEATR